MPGTTSFSDEDRARLATFKQGSWFGPREVDRCPHGRFLAFQWVLWQHSMKRPTAEDFQGADLAHVGGSCRNCHPGGA